METNASSSMGVRLAGSGSHNSDSSPYAEGHCNALEAAINGFMEGVKDLSILFMAVMETVCLEVWRVVKGISEWKYKRTHCKRKPGWWKPNTDF